MTNNIDINSDEFQAELEKTWKFVDKVNNQFGFVQNPDQEETQEERKKADNRICPCKPALEKEIPEDGLCHCGIFCTPEYAEQKEKENKLDEAVHTHSRGLSQEEVDMLVQKEQLDGDELESLIEARDIGMTKFTLIDVREPMEFQMGNIAGTDELLPTSQFYDWVNKIQSRKDERIILYCHTGSRSFQVQQILKGQGFKHIGNLTYGIISYPGEIVRG